MRDSHFTARVFRQMIARFTGNSKKSILNPHDIDELVDRLNALSTVEIVFGDKNHAHLSSQSLTLELNIPSQSSSGDSTTAFAIVELGHPDYFLGAQLSNVRLVDGIPTADVSAANTKIAKAKIVRRSILSEVLFGDTVNYSDDDATDTDNTRNADKGAGPERQVCLPPYIILTDLGFTDTVPMNAQCVVYAKRVPGLTGVFDDDGNAVDWMEDTAGVRAFAKRNS